MSIADAEFETFRCTHQELISVPETNKKHKRSSSYTVSQIMLKMNDWLLSHGKPGLVGYEANTDYTWLERVLRYLDPNDSLELFDAPLVDFLRSEVNIHPDLVNACQAMDFNLKRGRITTLGLLTDPEGAQKLKHKETELKKMKLQKRIELKKLKLKSKKESMIAAEIEELSKKEKRDEMMRSQIKDTIYFAEKDGTVENKHDSKKTTGQNSAQTQDKPPFDLSFKA